METLYCACCGRPFKRASHRGPAPLYCSQDCRRQIAVRRRAWSDVSGAVWGAAQKGRDGAHAATARF